MSQVFMKSAIATRVNPDAANKLYSESRTLGNPAMCPLSARHVDADEFSRPLGGASYRLLLTNDAACAPFTYTPQRKLLHENAERPVLGPCNPGDRGGGDFLFGNVRDAYPKNVYGEGDRGNFEIYKRLAEPIPNDYSTEVTPDFRKPLTLSHDALIRPFYG